VPVFLELVVGLLLVVPLLIAVWVNVSRRRRTPVSAIHHPVDAKPARCSFCDKDQDAVRKIIAGPSVFICDECIDLCNDIIAEEYERDAALPRSSGSSPARLASVPGCALCHVPSPIEHMVAIPDRGLLCEVCLDAIRAASAEDEAERC
jgi:hypothetical protein